MSDPELNVVAGRAANDGLCALGLRFSEDKLSPRERFNTLKDRLGDAFEVIEIDSGADRSVLGRKPRHLWRG